MSKYELYGSGFFSDLKDFLFGHCNYYYELQETKRKLYELKKINDSLAYQLYISEAFKQQNNIINDEIIQYIKAFELLLENINLSDKPITVEKIVEDEETLKECKKLKEENEKLNKQIKNMINLIVSHKNIIISNFNDVKLWISKTIKFCEEQEKINTNESRIYENWKNELITRYKLFEQSYNNIILNSESDNLTFENCVKIFENIQTYIAQLRAYSKFVEYFEDIIKTLQKFESSKINTDTPGLDGLINMNKQNKLQNQIFGSCHNDTYKPFIFTFIFLIVLVIIICIFIYYNHVETFDISELKTKLFKI